MEWLLCINFALRDLRIDCRRRFEFFFSAKTFAPGEARTPDLRISLSVLTYKYDALTDCATGAENHCPAFYGTHCENESA